MSSSFCLCNRHTEARFQFTFAFPTLECHWRVGRSVGFNFPHPASQRGLNCKHVYSFPKYFTFLNGLSNLTLLFLQPFPGSNSLCMEFLTVHKKPPRGEFICTGVPCQGNMMEEALRIRRS